MNYDKGTAYAESDADDEYERSLHNGSPLHATEKSPTTSHGRSSTEHTPTTYGHRRDTDKLPETIITEWTADEVADFIATVGLEQYSDRFAENEIVGEALVALLHDDLKSMGIASVGHRLTILKSVYEVKKAQDIPIESDHYVPLSADSQTQSSTATLKDIKHIVEQLRLRDERMSMLELDLRRVTEDYRRLREDMLPALRFAKNAAQPLPHLSSQGQAGHGYSYESATMVSPPAPTASAGLKRQYSTKQIMLEQSSDPANAGERTLHSSSHLAATNGGGGQQISPGYSPNMPSPTSPSAGGSGTLGSRTYRSEQPPSYRSTYTENDHGHNVKPHVAPRRMQTPAPDTPGNSSASVEIFKSFRVSMDDPCYKVLPAALKKYQINAPWDQYALYIVYGDQERCLGLDEKPLIIFKQLDKEGKKPMFMLRKTNTAQMDGEPGSAGSTATRSAAYDPPGGII